MRWLSVFSILALLAFWEALGMSGAIDLRFFPRPTAILLRFTELLSEGPMLLDLAVSLRRVALGTLLALPAALAVAVASALSPVVAAIFRPWVAFLYPLPKLALLPLLLVLFGIGEGAKVAMVSLGVFFLVLLNTAQGMRRLLASDFYDVAVVYRISLLARIFRVLLPGALPEILTGLKLGLGYGLVLVIAAEFTASERGIGVFLWNSWDHFRILDLYSALFALSCLGWAIFTLAELAERLWARFD